MTMLDNTFCFECLNPAQERHHVVPKSLGGTRTIPLCSECHGKIHNMHNRKFHRKLVLLGLKKARIEGRVGGRPRTINYKEVLRLHDLGLSYTQIYNRLGASRSAISKIIKLNKKRLQLEEELKYE